MMRKLAEVSRRGARSDCMIRELFRPRCICWGWAVCAVFALMLAFAGCSGSPSPTTTTVTQPGNPVGSNLTLMSSDPYTIGPGQHATEVEPHMLANGSTIVAAFQTGRISPGGATDIGWATSSDGGTTWRLREEDHMKRRGAAPRMRRALF